jgi:hypothetical protein
VSESEIDFHTLSDAALRDFTAQHIASLPSMKRKAQAKAREENILPALAEARQRIAKVMEQFARDKKRIAMGKKPTRATEPRAFLSCEGIEDFYRLVGVKPGTVWKWEHLKRQAAEDWWSSDPDDEDEALEQERVRRRQETIGANERAARQQAAQASRRAAQEAREAETLKEIITAGRKALAMKHHPDRGGSEEAMQNINEVADRLLKR